MDSKEFTQKCVAIWKYGYQKKAAAALGISTTTVGIYIKGVTTHGKIVTIKQETANKLNVIWSNKKAAG
jgi:DNA-binding transcriptional regulator YdaS (Cro superfamily)